MTRSEQPIGIVGIGVVGLALAERLRKERFAVTGHDRNASRKRALVDIGASAASDARGVFATCDRVVLALADDAQTADVLAAIAPRKDQIVIDVHTGDPVVAERLAEALAARGVAYIDSPLAATSAAIERGDAVAMIGGHPEAIAACDDLWPAIARQRFVLGAAGSGQKAKLATNLVLGLNRAALAEGLSFAEAVGIPGATFIELLRATPAYSRAVDAKGARMVARDYLPEARLSRQRRDSVLLLDVARRAGRGLPLTAAHVALLDAAIAAGEGELDSAAIVETLRRAQPES
jgi:3-hydroxyisobutyrate dehydrogenase-like beta-hydroxyacid dehydrogenase